jgi:hypothetical protein
MMTVYLSIDFSIYFIESPIRSFFFMNRCETKKIFKLLFISVIILRNSYSKRILNTIMKTWKDVVLKESLFNATTAIMIRFLRFLISKDILQRYNSSFYIRNTRIPLTIDEIFFFLNIFIFIWFLTFRRRNFSNIFILFSRLFLIFLLLFMLFLVPLN